MVGCFRTKFPVFVTVIVPAPYFLSKKEGKAGKGQNATAQVLPDGKMPALAVRMESGEKRFLPKALSFMCVSFCAVSSFIQKCLQKQAERKRHFELLLQPLVSPPIHLFSHSSVQSVLCVTRSSFQAWNRTIPQPLCCTLPTLVGVGRNNYRDCVRGTECQGILKLFSLSRANQNSSKGLLFCLKLNYIIKYLISRFT